MLVLINGLPYFAQRMEKDFNEYDPKNRYVYCNTYYSKWGRLKFFFLLPFARGVISLNGVSENSRALNWVLSWKKRLILYWQGTDVDIANKRFDEGTMNRKYVDQAKHLVVAPWFVEELTHCKVKAEYVPYAHVDKIGNDGRYDAFRVLTYLAKGAEDFYGWQPVKEFAAARPDIPITVVGSEGLGLEQFPNVEFLGWVSDEEMLQLFRTHAVYVRLTEHDGKSFAVAQALSAGCEVIWTYKYFQCHTLQRDGAQLIDKMDELKHLVEERNLRPNAENIAHSIRSYERSLVLSRLVAKIKELLR